MNYLKYDTDLMLNVKKIYEECVTQMDEIKSKMQGMVTSLETNWKTEAGDAFFEKYNREWLEGFTQYKEVLEHMASNLETASDSYSLITTQINAVKIK